VRVQISGPSGAGVPGQRLQQKGTQAAHLLGECFPFPRTDERALELPSLRQRIPCSGEGLSSQTGAKQQAVVSLQPFAACLCWFFLILPVPTERPLTLHFLTVHSPAPGCVRVQGQRALDFVLKNQGLIDKTLLFDIELLKVLPS